MRPAFPLLTAAAVLASLLLQGHFCQAKDEDEDLLKDLNPDANVKAEPVAKDLKTVSVEDFAASREVFKKRPQPSGLNFDDAAVAKYISSLPAELQKREGDRYGNIKKVKFYLISLFERNQYDGSMLLAKGAPKGKPVKRHLMVTMANEKFLVTKTSQQSKPVRCGWGDLDFGQYPEFFEYFIAKKSAATGGNVSKADISRNVARDYLLLAMLCDWYGQYEEALDYARKSIESNPKIEGLANSLLIVGGK